MKKKQSGAGSALTLPLSRREREKPPNPKSKIQNPKSTVHLSNPTKVFWPEEGYTKFDLARFYDMVFPNLKPYVKDRLLSLERCPDGMKGQCFIQKEKPPGMPADTPTKAVKHEKGTTNYVLGGKLETQLALVNLGCIAVHVWGSRAADPRKPDCADADDVRGFADQLGARLSAAYPKELTMEGRIAARKGRVYLDPFRNGFAQTVVSPFCVRHAPGAPVSTPLDWKEVTASLKPADFNLGNFAARLEKTDPWADFFASRQDLKPALKALKNL